MTLRRLSSAMLDEVAVQESTPTLHRDQLARGARIVTAMKPTSRSVSDRLVARAVVLAMDPVLVIEACAETLVQLADGSRSALEQALRRIEWGHLDRPSRYAATATETIRVALRMLEAAVNPDAPTSSPAQMAGTT